MAIISKPYTFVAGTTAKAAEVNSDFDTVYNEFNGNISNTNISGTAAIADSKLAQISTAGKVSGAALTSLSSIPAAAGDVPAANLNLSGSEVFALTDGATIATDASVASIFTVTLGGNRTLSNPTNSADGMKRTWRIKQDATGFRTLTLGTDFRIPTDIAANGQEIFLTRTATKIDYMGAIYNGDDSKWDVVALTRGI
jgi:hypothetical protein